MTKFEALTLIQQALKAQGYEYDLNYYKSDSNEPSFITQIDTMHTYWSCGN